ncbi:DNA-directed RNA polymerase subunit omega [Halobacillus sp. ACCC02827]|uniref:DNA-directed RNA polymerase subunit omega n=1 Tax=Bacillaceae TaxID=186817 RepID=UPI0002A4E1B2|nr:MULTISPECIES: DNA-directed RNA polymerase subunit omega [Bacillaceae]ELK46141.1 DNA-directed RNA polymerase subunit omega [Halobacillus sp. BAB-2008]QHT46596.1 DNA-directed RNA polymerase subunit omega [Bacillus sp. SB49]WJE17408.1 DNA-directed RNA polymerase subunit omega [Halobacillus sp. ACCC02827]
MMLEPSIDSLQKKIKSKYTIVTLSARRARELKQGSAPMVENPNSFQQVGVALEEIDSGKLNFIESDEIQARTETL